MAELHIIGQIKSGRDFGPTGVFCKWLIETGSSWKRLEGSASGQTQVDTPEEYEVAQWCHPVEVHYISKGLQGWPRLVLEIKRQDQFGRSDIAGYGTCHIPPTPGTHTLSIPTWRPAGTLRNEVVRYFLGGGTQLSEPNFILDSNERYRLKTVPSGTVIAEINIIARNFDKFGVEI